MCLAPTEGLKHPYFFPLTTHTNLTLFLAPKHTTRTFLPSAGVRTTYILLHFCAKVPRSHLFPAHFCFFANFLALACFGLWADGQHSSQSYKRPHAGRPGADFWFIFFFYFVFAFSRFSLCVTYERHTQSHAPGEARRSMAAINASDIPFGLCRVPPSFQLRLRSCRSLTSVMVTSGRGGFGPEWRLAADP